MVIPSTVGIHQGNPLGAALFSLAHFMALHYIINHFPCCIFPFIANDTQIIKPPSIVSSTYEHFQAKFCAIGLSIQPKKCVAWSPFGLLLEFDTPS
jgi:hypothetical protein